MSIASALFAPAAPVSTGPSAAASDTAATDANLFAGKLAAVADDVTVADPGAAPARPAASAPKAVLNPFVVTQVEETDLVTPAVEEAANAVVPVEGDDHAAASAPQGEVEKPRAANDDLVAVHGFPTSLPLTALLPVPPTLQTVDASEAAAPAVVQASGPDQAVKASVDLMAPPGASAKTVASPSAGTEVAETTTAVATPDKTQIDKDAAAAVEAVTTADVKTGVSAPVKTDASAVAGQPVDQERKAAEAQPVAAKAQPVSADQVKTATPLAQALSAAQIPAAQVQVVATAPSLKPAPSDATSSVVAALLAEPDAETAAEPGQVPADPLSGSLRPSRHAMILQAKAEAASGATPDASSNAQAKTTTDPTPPASPTVAKLVAAAAPTDAAALSNPDPAAPPTTTAPVGGETQPAQQTVAADRDLGLSTLSRATVETTAHLAAQIARKLDGRSTRFDMVLTPEDLGRVDVSLEIGKDGQLSARLAFDNPAAAADLRGRADELRRQLQDAGFQVAGDALDFSQREASAGGGGAFDRQQQRNALFAGGGRLAAQADTPVLPAPGAWINHSLTPERVDLKV